MNISPDILDINTVKHILRKYIIVLISYRVMVKLRNIDLQPLEVLPLGLRIFTNIIKIASETKNFFLIILMVRILQKQDYDLWRPHGRDSGCLQ